MTPPTGGTIEYLSDLTDPMTFLRPHLGSRPLFENPCARPIVSGIETYTFGLAKFLVPLLQPLASNQYTINSSLPFLKESSIFSFSHNSIMDSFGVSSLVRMEETVLTMFDNPVFIKDEIES